MVRGQDGQPLPVGSVVLRMCVANLNADGKGIGDGALPVMFARVFELSSADRDSTPPYLSVYDESVTTPVQAFALTGRTKPMVLRLPVDEIRTVPSPTPGVSPLDVCWYTAYLQKPDGSRTPDTRPGAEGHCGIIGWQCSTSHRKTYRLRLAEIARAHGPFMVTSA